MNKNWIVESENGFFYVKNVRTCEYYLTDSGVPVSYRWFDRAQDKADSLNGHADLQITESQKR